MKRALLNPLGLLLICGAAMGGFLKFAGSQLVAEAAVSVNPVAAPPFTHTDQKDWLNSPPLTWEQLRGQVVLLDFWTYDCWNCYHSIPWLHSLESRYRGKALKIIGVHSPELPQEYLRSNVVAKVLEFKLTNPIMIDNDHSYWDAVGNQYWPAFYLIDKKGRVRAVFAGETHEGDGNAKTIEEVIDKLLAENK